LTAATAFSVPEARRDVGVQSFSLPFSIAGEGRLAPALALLLAALVCQLMLLILLVGGAASGWLLQALTGAILCAGFGAAAVTYAHVRRRDLQLNDLSTRLVTALEGQQAAEAANLAKARHLANLSHEIRSPLNAIYGYAQLIEQQIEERPQRAAKVIRRSAEHMTSLVESLLDISLMENGMLRVRSEIVHLPEFLDQIVSMMRPAAKAKGLELRYEAETRVPELVRTDQNRLRQALLNLIGNAIKFTDQGSVSLAVRYRGQVATFEIRDTGPGIAAEDQARIFDPYERVGVAGARVQAGVGLGLPITKAIVQILGGDLQLESEPGHGACFRLRLMLSEPVGAPVADAPRRRITGHEGPARSILIVDDDADQRGFVEEFLLGCGFEVISVADGETAVALCAARRFDLAILDITLPGISGWETAAMIPQRTDRDTVIVMASANADELQRPDFHRPTHDHFLVKPFRLEELTDTIGALLGLSWRWQAAAGTSTPHNGTSSAVPAPALPHLKRLQERISIGHVRGIETEIALLAAAAPQQRDLVEALYAALDTFDLAAMESLLEHA